MSFGLLGALFEDTVTLANDLVMLQNYRVTGHMMQVKNIYEIHFLKDDAAPHYATAAHNYMNKAFNMRVTGQCAVIKMSPCIYYLNEFLSLSLGCDNGLCVLVETTIIDQLRAYIKDLDTVWTYVLEYTKVFQTVFNNTFLQMEQ